MGPNCKHVSNEVWVLSAAKVKRQECHIEPFCGNLGLMQAGRETVAWTSLVTEGDRAGLQTCFAWLKLASAQSIYLAHAPSSCLP